MIDIVECFNDSLSVGYSELIKEAAVETMRLRGGHYIFEVRIPKTSEVENG